MIRSVWKAGSFYIRWKAGLVVAAFLLVTIDIALRLTSYHRVCRWLVLLSPEPNPNRVDVAFATTIGYLVDRAARMRLIQATCLRRSLVLWWVLRWVSMPSQLRFGINRDSGHVWVEHANNVVNDRKDIASHFMITYGNELLPETMAEFVKATDQR